MAQAAAFQKFCCLRKTTIDVSLTNRTPSVQVCKGGLSWSKLQLFLPFGLSSSSPSSRLSQEKRMTLDEFAALRASSKQEGRRLTVDPDVHSLSLLSSSIPSAAGVALLLLRPHRLPRANGWCVRPIRAHASCTASSLQAELLLARARSLCGEGPLLLL